MAERERPGQLLRPVALQDMQIGAANAAGADFYQCRLPRNFRPWHVANNRLRTGAVIGANANLLHEISPALRRLLIAVRGRTEAYVKQAAMPMCGLCRLAAQLTGASRRLNLRQLRSGMRRCATAGILAVLFVARSPWFSSFKRCCGRAATGQRVRR